MNKIRTSLNSLKADLGEAKLAFEWKSLVLGENAKRESFVFKPIFSILRLFYLFVIILPKFLLLSWIQGPHTVNHVAANGPGAALWTPLIWLWLIFWWKLVEMNEKENLPPPDVAPSPQKMLPPQLWGIPRMSAAAWRTSGDPGFVE